MLDAIQLRTTTDNNIRITNCLYLDGTSFQEKVMYFNSSYHEKQMTYRDSRKQMNTMQG